MEGNKIILCLILILLLYKVRCGDGPYTLYHYVSQAKRMDVVWGETAGVDGQLLLMCPILFTLQVVRLALQYYMDIWHLS